MDEHPKTSNHGEDDTSIDIGFDLQEAVTQRLAFLSKKTVQLNDLLSATKFTKQEICHMYRGFKQVRLQIFGIMPYCLVYYISLFLFMLNMLFGVPILHISYKIM